MSQTVCVDALIAAARSWVGTPVAQVGAEKGVGCNCIGFAAGVAKELGLKALWDAFEPYQGHRIPVGRKTLLVALETHLERTDSIQRGCLLATVDLPRVDHDSHHVAVVSRVLGDDIRVIEALGRTVGEWPLVLGGINPKRKLVRAFAIPGVEYN